MDIKTILGSIARHASTALAGILIAKGVPPEIVDPANQLLVGGIVYFGSQLASLLQKKKYSDLLGKFKF